MQIRRPQIIRSPPSNRGQIQISLSMKIKAHVHENSFIHIGAGRTLVMVPKELDNIVKKERVTIDDLRRISRQMRSDVEPTFKVNDKPIIPGSSLKGAIRSRVEYLFKSSPHDVPACFRVQSRQPITSRIKRRFWRHFLIWGEDVVSEVRQGCDPKRGDVCVVCDLFGAPGLLSKVFFGNALPINDVKLEVLTVRFGRGRLVKVEAIPPRSEFKFKMVVNGASLEQLGLLFLGMRVNEGKPILIGKFKYREVETNKGVFRFGRLILKIEKINAASFSRNAIEKEGMNFENVQKFVEKCVVIAKNKFKGYMRNIDETRELF
ncbi:MAG: hypothetical protein J7L07_03955 [Candidatus Odinarchaeota archaeon]|nr:hypothetical protein [Candidatus Odinarchaeota archaeon]